MGGELTLDDGGLSLHLFGTFGTDRLEPGVIYPQPGTRQAVIHGVAGGQAFTLLNSECGSARFPGRGNTELWRVEAAVEAHLEPPADEGPMEFEGIKFSLRNLGLWARARHLERTSYFGPTARVEIGAQPHELAAFDLGGRGVLRIEQGLLVNSTGLDLSIFQPVAVAVRVASPTTWQELLDQWLQPIQVLLWLASIEPSSVDNLQVLVHDEHFGQSIWVPLHAPVLQPGGDGRDVLAPDVLFFADQFRGGFSSGISRWWELWEQLKHVLGPLFARDRSPFVYANDRFYAAAAAIEAYHRYCEESQRDLPRGQHRERVRRLRGILVQHAPDLEDWAVNAATPSITSPSTSASLRSLTFCPRCQPDSPAPVLSCSLDRRKRRVTHTPTLVRNSLAPMTQIFSSSKVRSSTPSQQVSSGS